MLIRNRLYRIIAIVLAAGLALVLWRYATQHGYASFSGSTCFHCRASHIVTTTFGLRFQRLKETECSRWYASHRPPHAHRWIPSPMFRKISFPPYMPILDDFVFSRSSSTRCGFRPSSYIAWLRPEAQLEFLKSSSPEDETYFFTKMVEHGDMEVQRKLYEEIAVRWQEKYNNGSPKQAWEERHNTAAIQVRRFQHIVSQFP